MSINQIRTCALIERAVTKITGHSCSVSLSYTTLALHIEASIEGYPVKTITIDEERMIDAEMNQQPFEWIETVAHQIVLQHSIDKKRPVSKIGKMIESYAVDRAGNVSGRQPTHPGSE